MGTTRPVGGFATESVAALPIVMLTTEGRPALMRQARASGAKGWIVKPFNPDQFL